jgi:hypothetical protein
MNSNFQTSNNIFEFGFNRDYLKEMDCSFKTNEVVFNFPENNNIFESLKFEEFQSPKAIMDVDKDLFAFESEQDEFESLNCFNYEGSPSDSLNNVSNNQRAKKVNSSNTHPSLSIINQESYKKIETCDKLSIFDEDFSLEKECLDGDLNSFVEKLLNSTAVDYLKDLGIEVDEKTAQLLTLNKRKRKTKNQLKLLEVEYEKTQKWSKSFMKVLGDRLGMTVSSIYKWHWDQRSKTEKPVGANLTKKIRISSMSNSSAIKRVRTE